VSVLLCGPGYLGNGDAVWRESLHDGRSVSKNDLLFPWWRIFTGHQMRGSRKGRMWAICCLSDNDLCDLTANISKMVSRSVTCELEPGPSLVGGTIWTVPGPRASKGPRAQAADCCKRRNHAPCMIFQILKLKCTKCDFGWGSVQTPLGELAALPRPPTWI